MNPYITCIVLNNTPISWSFLFFSLFLSAHQKTQKMMDWTEMRASLWHKNANIRDEFQLIGDGDDIVPDIDQPDIDTVNVAYDAYTSTNTISHIKTPSVVDAAGRIVRAMLDSRNKKYPNRRTQNQDNEKFIGRISEPLRKVFVRAWDIFYTKAAAKPVYIFNDKQFQVKAFAQLMELKVASATPSAPFRSTHRPPPQPQMQPQQWNSTKQILASLVSTSGQPPRPVPRIPRASHVYTPATTTTTTTTMSSGLKRPASIPTNTSGLIQPHIQPPETLPVVFPGSDRDLVPLMPPGSTIKLFKHQEYTIRRALGLLAEKHGDTTEYRPGIIIAHEMGLGKTYTSLHLAYALRQIVRNEPSVLDNTIAKSIPTVWRRAFGKGIQWANKRGPIACITVPSVTVADQWKNSAEKMKLKMLFYHGEKRHSDLVRGYHNIDFVITTDATLRSDFSKMIRSRTKQPDIEEGEIIEEEELSDEDEGKDNDEAMIDGIVVVAQIQQELIRLAEQRIATLNATVTESEMQKYGIYACGPFMTIIADEIHNHRNHVVNIEGVSNGSITKNLGKATPYATSAKLTSEYMFETPGHHHDYFDYTIPYGPHLWYHGMVHRAAPNTTKTEPDRYPVTRTFKDGNGDIQYRKITKTPTSNAVLLLRRLGVWMIGLSGTPINRKIDEIATLAIMIGDVKVGSRAAWSDLAYSLGVGMESISKISVISKQRMFQHSGKLAAGRIASYILDGAAAQWVTKSMIRMQLGKTVGMSPPEETLIRVTPTPNEVAYIASLVERGYIADKLIEMLQKAVREKETSKLFTGPQTKNVKKKKHIKELLTYMIAIITYVRIASTSYHVLMAGPEEPEEPNDDEKEKEKEKGKGKGKGKEKDARPAFVRPKYTDILTPDTIGTKIDRLLQSLAADLSVNLATIVDPAEITEFSIYKTKPQTHGVAKVLIFSRFTSLLEALHGYVERIWFQTLPETTRRQGIRSALFTGRVSARNRSQILADFENDPTLRVMFVNSAAGGVGINMTSAQFVYHLEPHFNTAVHQQSQMRAWRIGQQYRVFVRWFLHNNSFENWIYDHTELGRRTANAIVDGIVNADDKELDPSALFRAFIASASVSRAASDALIRENSDIPAETWIDILSDIRISIRDGIAAYRSQRIEKRKCSPDVPPDFFPPHKFRPREIPHSDLNADDDDDDDDNDL